MTAPAPKLSQSIANVVGETPDYRFYFLSEVLKCRVVSTQDSRSLGGIRDLVVRIAAPYPQVVGLLVDHGWGKPSEFFPWDRVASIRPGLITLSPMPDDPPYRPYQDQPGWLLLDEHLMGQNILDLDGRRTKEVTDLHLLESKGRMLLVHVDTTRRHPLHFLGVGRGASSRDQLISWRIFRPLSVEDTSSETIMLSVTRKAAKYMPGEDLAAALEELKRQEQSSASRSSVQPSLSASSDFVAVSGSARADEILASLRNAHRRPDSASTVFVTGTDGSLRGAIDLPVLALAAADARADSLMAACPLTLKPDAKPADAVESFRDSILRVLPVVDASGRLVGAVHRSDFVR